MLKRLSPVPITFTELECPEDIGVFFWSHGETLFSGTGERIEVSENLQQSQRIAILSHEVGHALCFEKKCKCFENSDIAKREIHAHKYSLRFLLKHEQKESLKWLINDIEERSAKYDLWEKILKHLIKSKLWQKCLNFVNNP